MDQFLPTVFERTGPIGRRLRSLKPDLAPYANEAKASLNRSIDELVVGADDERASRVARFCRDVFLVNGYFKFVHPEAGGEPRMDFQAFMAVIGRPTDTRGSSGATAADDGRAPTPSITHTSTWTGRRCSHRKRRRSSPQVLRFPASRAAWRSEAKAPEPARHATRSDSTPTCTRTSATTWR